MMTVFFGNNFFQIDLNYYPCKWKLNDFNFIILLSKSLQQYEFIKVVGLKEKLQTTFEVFSSNKLIYFIYYQISIDTKESNPTQLTKNYKNKDQQYRQKIRFFFNCKKQIQQPLTIKFYNKQASQRQMSPNNHLISINSDNYLIRLAPNKLVLHHLPSLDIVHKYYAQISFFYVNRQQIMTLNKGVLTFLKPKCPPLRLIQYQQTYLDWQPIGGLSMSNLVVLYDKTTIAFYYRTPKLQKSWSINVIQQIEQVKNSYNEKHIALKVKQPKNTIFIWDIGNMSKKPNQQIILKEEIVRWQFYGDNVLIVMTKKELKMYFVNENNNHFIQYYIPLNKVYKSCLTLNELNVTEIGSGRRSVNTVAFLIPGTCDFDVVELYDIEKRNKKFKHSEFMTYNFSQKQKLVFSKAIAGYEYERKILILGEVDTGIQSYEPKCLVLNKNFQLQKVTQYKQHEGIGLQNIQAQGNFVFWLDKKQNKYRLGRFVTHDGKDCHNQASQNIKLLAQYPSQNIQNAFLTKQRIFFINQDKKAAIIEGYKILYQEFHQQNNDLSFSIDFGKVNPNILFYLFENESGVYFVYGIRYFKFDFNKNELVNLGFVLKNERAKLHEVRTTTFSLVYKISEQYILIEYTTPKTAAQKVIFRTIKSSNNDKVISLRKDKWARVNLKQIVYGEGERQLVSFSMQKMFKTLLQQNSYFDFDLYWTTHNGIILIVKNYLFFLQVAEGENGSEIHLIKKGHSYLYRRFSSNITSQERVKIIDPRNLIVYTGNRIVKLASQVEHYVTENPYDMPDTLLQRQLQMREYFCPHHPMIVVAMLENGWFDEIIKVMEKVQTWVRQPDHNIRGLYHMIKIADYYEIKTQTHSLSGFEHELEGFQSLQVKPATHMRNEGQDVQNLRSLCEQIITHPQLFQLPENNPLVLENILNAIIFKLENSRAFDYFSETIITKTRIHSNKTKPFTTMDVAFLLHSNNKDQALEFLKSPEHKMQWSWIQKYSIALWYNENVQKWKKWIEQIAMTQFRAQKDPFDCLFWYILAGKKNLLITLFKAQKFNSKEHDAMHTFLQRDFQDQKHKTAALKNAYALIDKKRYVHAMAFFLLADKKQECIRFAIDRLNDINLAFLIHMVSYGSNSTQMNQVNKYMIEKGDVWAQHIGWVKQKKHIASYNVLLKDSGSVSWDYTPQLKGFHPAVIEFSQKIKQSIPYKRQLQMKNTQTVEVTQNFDHLTFNSDSFDIQEEGRMLGKVDMCTKVETQQEVKQPQYYNEFYEVLGELSEQEENGFKRCLDEKAIKYYMKLHFPCLALTIVTEQLNKSLYIEVTRAYELQKYILTKQLSQSVIEIAQDLDDIMSLARKNIELVRYDLLLEDLTSFRQRFESAICKIKINELNPPQKHQIGEMLYYSYFSQQLILLLQPIASHNKNQKLLQQLSMLMKTNSLGKIISGISLKVYQQMSKSLEAFKNKIFIQAKEEFWTKCREKYDQMIEKKKEKHQKLMDVFELSLNNHIKKEKDDQHVDFNIRMPKSSTMSILLWRRIFTFLTQCDQYLKEKLLQLKLRLDKIVHYWVQSEYIKEIEHEIMILVTEGAEFRLKLNVISEEFKSEGELEVIEELLKVIYETRELAEMEKNNKMLGGSQGNISIGEVVVSYGKGYQTDKHLHLHKHYHSQNEKSNNINSNAQKSAIEVFKNKIDGLRLFALNVHQGQGLQAVVIFKKCMRKFQVIENLVNRDRTKDGTYLIHEDSAFVTDAFQPVDEEKTLPRVSLNEIYDSARMLFLYRRELEGDSLIKRTQKYVTRLNDYLKQSENVSQVDFCEIYSIESHSSLPIFFLGGKGLIEVCSFEIVKNYNRIQCPGMLEIVKIQSIGQRLYVLDKEGNLACYFFDDRFASKVVFELKKLGIIDFSCPTPSQVGIITTNSAQFYDTLLHPKRQCVFKVQMSTPPVAIASLSATMMVILRKNEVQIYDVVKDQLTETFNIQGRGRCLLVDQLKSKNSSGKIVVARHDCKVRIIDLQNKQQRTIRIGPLQEQKDKVFPESLKKFGNCYFCLRNDGSIYYFND